MTRRTKKQIGRLIRKRGGEYHRSWTKARLLKYEEELIRQGRLATIVREIEVNPTGNWNSAKDWFPLIEVDQDLGIVTVITHCTHGHQKYATVDTISLSVECSPEHDQVLIRGEVDCRNWRNPKCSGQQGFVFAIFRGDSGHVYIHRAPNSVGWRNTKPENIRKRLVKLGIGSTRGVIQQGDFLLKPATKKAYPDKEFKHETVGAGHHKFTVPVLYADGGGNRQYKITEPTVLRHEAVDGIQHPDVTVPPGVYIVGTTSTGLNHINRGD